MGRPRWITAKAFLLDERNGFVHEFALDPACTVTVQEALAAATQAGTIKPTPFGTMSYRLYGKKDRIQLLWVLSVPGATAQSIGVSDADHREEAINGRGVPWLMLAGTPGAHIMIPINK